MLRRALLTAAILAVPSSAAIAAVSLPGLSILPHAPVIAHSAEPTHRPWMVTLDPTNPKLLHKIEHQVRGGSGIAVTQSALAALHRAGYPMVHATVVPASHQIQIQIARFPASGSLATFFPENKPVTVSRLNASLPLLSAAALANHERVNLGLDSSMTLTTTTSPAPGRSFGAGTVLSSYGPRYAGSDVISSYGYAHIGGYNISGSITRGLPDLTPKQSHGGAYVGENMSVDHPTPYGILNLNLSHAHFMTGGVLRPLKLHGYITQVSAGDKYPVLGGKLGLRGGLTYASDRERLGALNWGTDQNNISAYAGLTGSTIWHHTIINMRATFYHGLVGSDISLTGSPNLMGAWSADYNAERIRVSATRNLGPVSLRGVIGGQHGSAGTPEVMQGYIGGEDRGSSYFTGSYSGPSGYWYSASASKAAPIILHSRGLKLSIDPFITINGGTVFPAVGRPDQIASIGGGVKFTLARHLTGQLGYSRTLVHPAGSHQASMFNFQLVSSF